MTYVELLVGFVILIGGAEVLVRGAVSLAGRFGSSPMVIGMTVVAVGTSAPELVVSVNAALEGATGLAVGNVIGSNIANILLVLGVACIMMPILERPAALKRDGALLLFGTLLFVGLCMVGVLDTKAGILLLIGFFCFLGISYWRESSEPDLASDHIQEVEDLQGWPQSLGACIAAVVVGLVGLALGAEFLVDSGTVIARTFGVSEEVIGLTLFALGTSLPELAATVIAAMKGHSEIGIGNIVGSNLFNILGVAGAASLTASLPVGEQILQFDLWIMLGSTMLLVPVLVLGWRITRFTGMLFLLGYVGYIWAQAFGVSRLFA